MPFTAHVPVGAALFRLPGQSSCPVPRYRCREYMQCIRNSPMSISDHVMSAQCPTTRSACHYACCPAFHQHNVHLCAPDPFHIFCRQSCGRQEPQRHQALRLAEQGLMAPLPLILQPCSESWRSNIEASLPDAMSIQV